MKFVYEGRRVIGKGDYYIADGAVVIGIKNYRAKFKRYHAGLRPDGR